MNLAMSREKINTFCLTIGTVRIATQRNASQLDKYYLQMTLIIYAQTHQLQNNIFVMMKSAGPQQITSD